MTRSLSGSITIRLDTESARVLRKTARERRQSVSEVVRSLIERDLAGSSEPRRSALEKSIKYVGAVRAPTSGRESREALEGWSPDRRG